MHANMAFARMARKAFITSGNVPLLAAHIINATGARHNPKLALTARGTWCRDILQLFNVCVGRREYLQWGTLHVGLRQAMQLCSLKSTLGQLARLPKQLQLPAAHEIRLGQESATLERIWSLQTSSKGERR